MTFLAKTANPNAYNPSTATLQGARAYFRPRNADGTVNTTGLWVYFAHFLKPSRTDNFTFAELKTADTGRVKISAKALSEVTQGFEFETGAAADPYVRSLWNGSAIYGGPAAFAATTAYVLYQTVKPTTFTGLYWIVTTAGTSGAAEPTWSPTAVEGSTQTSGTVTFTASKSEGFMMFDDNPTTTNGEFIAIYPSAITLGAAELDYRPFCNLSSNGKGQGTDGAQFTTLKFQVEMLDASSYIVPAALQFLKATNSTGFGPTFRYRKDSELTILLDTLGG